MLRAASSGRQLLRLAGAAGTRGVASSSAASEGSVASLIKAVNESSAKSFASGGLNSIKAAAQPYFPAAAKDTGLSLNAQIALGAGAVYFWHRYTVHASSPDWIVDLSLDVLQAAWWISFLSFLPFRSIYVSLRGIAPASAGPLSALKPTAFIKP